jgi:hypothetical protein
MDVQADTKCYAHYRAAVAVCRSCGRGLCGECAERSVDGQCPECDQRERSRLVHDEIRRDARLALRRAGVAVPRATGDPVFLRADGHPLLAGLLLAVAVILAMAMGAAETTAELHWGYPRAAIAPALAVAVGIMVSGVFGGTSRVAGTFAVLLYLLAVASGPEALAMVATGVVLPGHGDAAAWFASHHPVALACYGVSALLAYVAAAGRRIR